MKCNYLLFLLFTVITITCSGRTIVIVEERCDFYVPSKFVQGGVLILKEKGKVETLVKSKGALPQLIDPDESLVSANSFATNNAAGRISYSVYEGGIADEFYDAVREKIDEAQSQKSNFIKLNDSRVLKKGDHYWIYHDVEYSGSNQNRRVVTLRSSIDG